jgi:hypothetical protein
MEMEDREFGGAQRSAAITAGVGLVLMMFPAILANFFVIQNTLVAGDAAATVNNMLANESAFRLAILGFIAVAILDVLVAWGLYVFFIPAGRFLSLLAGWFRLVYSAILVVGILELARALRLVQSAAAVEAWGAGPLEMAVQMALHAFEDVWALGLILFGIHLILIGVLAWRTAVPNWLAVLLVIAGAGYAFDTVASLLMPDFAVTISQLTFIGEMVLAVWLLIKSVSVKRWPQFVLKTAQ